MRGLFRMRLFGRSLSRHSSKAIETRDAAVPHTDEIADKQLEVALHWRGELLRVEHHPPVLVASAADFGVPEDAHPDAGADLPLPQQIGESTWAHFGDLSLRLTLTFAGRAPGRFVASSDSAGSIALSALGHAAMLSMLAWGFVASGGESVEEISRERIAEMRAMLAASDARAQVESDSLEDGTSTGHDDGASEVPRAAAARGEEGVPGSRNANVRDRAHVLAGASGDPSRETRQDLAREAAAFGIVNLLSTSGAAGTPGVFAREPEAGRGNLWGDSIEDVFGAGGVGLSGVGEGGGGRGEGIGVGAVGAIGCGCGEGSSGFGKSSGRLGGGHVVKSPVIRCGGTPSHPEGCATSVVGRLPPEVIQRVVRANFNRFRYCYEQGLTPNPSLVGRVAVKFVIGRDGSVAVAQDAGSELPNQSVVQCVVRTFQSLSFPQPEGGIVTVLYPLSFSPGE